MAHRHGLSDHPLAHVRNSMYQRCYNPKHHAYKDYGGRGIVICDEWLGSYDKFINWALKNGYKRGLSIDRIDNNQGYSPDNCRFVTMKENARNRRDNVYIEHNGRMYVQKEFYEKFAVVPLGTIRPRIMRWKCDFKTAALTPQQRGIKFQGVTV